MIDNPIAFVEQNFGIRLKRVGRTEWAGPCPWCGGTDRFHVWERSNYMCRVGPGHCGRSGWLDELDNAKPVTDADRLAWRVAALERQVAEHAERLAALEYMHSCKDHLTYHNNLTEQAIDYWLGEGITCQTIADRKLGYCPSCPTAPGQPSYTIPVTFRNELYNIRHRLVNPPDKGGKYRPHRAGLPAMLYNADDLDRATSDMMILEGEKKSIVVSQETQIPNIAMMGKQSFKPEWAAKLSKFKTVYVCLDPDATEEAFRVAQMFNGRGRVVRLPVKADDFFSRHSGTKAEFMDFVRTARPV